MYYKKYEMHNWCVKCIKHVSTLKSLTPKRLTEKNKKTKEDIDDEKTDMSGNSNL